MILATDLAALMLATHVAQVGLPRVMRARTSAVSLPAVAAPTDEELAPTRNVRADDVACRSHRRDAVSLAS